MPSPPDSQLDWEAHRGRIADLYLNQGKELPEVMGIVESVYGFVASKKMYKKHLKAWGLEKNLKTAESIAMLRIAEQRRIANKETLFKRHGRPVEPGKLRRFAKRHKLTTDTRAGPPNGQVATPPGITYTTPEPDPSSNSLPPVHRPSRDPGTSETDQETMEASPGSHTRDGDARPPSRCALWTPPVSMSWPGHSSPDAQGSNRAGMGDHLIPDVFSDCHQMAELSHNTSRSNLDPTFPSPSWLTDTRLHECQTFTDGTPSWIFHQQPEQHEVHALSHCSNYDPSAFPKSFSPNMGHAMLGMANSCDNTSPTHDISPIPDVARCILDHSQLHDAVVANDLDLSRSLLEGGANPNCVARGGMTPLHYAAYQRNQDLVGLLLEYRANLDAMTDKGRSILFFAVRSQCHLGNRDMLAYAHHNHVGSGSHSDEHTVRIIDALFNSPSRWTHLLRSLDKADKDGATPLMVAAGEGFQKTATMLLERGACPQVRDHAGHTAIKYAARNNHRDLVRLLLLADPGVSCDRDLSHILKLASKNFTVRSTTESVQEKDGQSGRSGAFHGFTSALIAEEMVRLCRELGLLHDLLALAEQRRKTNVLELLLAATRHLDMKRQGSHGLASGP